MSRNTGGAFFCENTQKKTTTCSYILTGSNLCKQKQKGRNMKHRTMKRLLSAVLMTAMLCTALPANLTEAKAASGNDMVIAIDPGHGGAASGASYGGIKEKDVNLTIAKYIKTYLEDYECVQVYMTRETDVDVVLSKRVSDAVAAGADVFISIHNIYIFVHI